MRELDKGAMVPKDNIAGDMKMMRDKIIKLIPLLSFVIAKKTTKSRSRLKFVLLMWLKKNETGRIEGVKVVIVWSCPKKVLIWSLILDDRTGNVINKMKSSFALKGSRNFGRKKESMNSVNNMIKFLFGSTILLRGI